ncbi:hypothetical protein TWF225_000444 [Orbilia oligospora]|nr:hypothetical protein TWF225_000444 [Orbilia oligospora]KAF3237806.1 hypothetical protein TWF128_000797 [Orbilia oligospora]KAF3268297.1 hypothetical protein TWF217_010894 [Orbilia oligospora]KAF3276233.1 hypothetical protein TWF132_002282 [Orbilia oligospora]
MRKKSFYHIFLTGLLCLLWATACQGNNTNDDDDEEKPFRDLGWSEPYDSMDIIECVLFVKQEYWNDLAAHNLIRSTLIKDILEADPNVVGIENDEVNQETVYFGQWNDGIGRAYYVVQTEYHVIADLILDKFRKYLGAWLDAPIERRLIDKMMEADGRLQKDASDAGSSSGGSSRRYSAGSSTSSRRYSQGRRLSKGSGSDTSTDTEEVADGRFLDIRWLTTPPNGKYGRADLDWETWWNLRTEYFRGAQGQGIDVYVVDSGLSAAAGYHQAFASPSYRRHIGQWMKTDVTSKIVGSTTGLAINSRVINAIFNPDGERNRNGHFYVDILLSIRKAILQKPISAKSIINLSVVFDGHLRKDKNEFGRYSFLKEIEREYFDLVSRYADVALDKILELDNVIVVTGTGNEPVGRPILDWPAKRGTKKTSNLVVVGKADEQGRLSGHVEAEFVKVYGVANYITVPFIRSNQALEINAHREEYVEEVGISLVIPMISGILASHMSENPTWTPLQAVEKLYKDAYPYEKDSNIKMAWVGPVNKVQKRSEPSGSWPISEDGDEGSEGDKKTGKGEMGGNGRGDREDEADEGDKDTGREETDEEGESAGKEKKNMRKTKKPRCSPGKSTWRRLGRRKDGTRSDSKNGEDEKGSQGPARSGSDDIGFDDTGEYNDEYDLDPDDKEHPDPDVEEDCEDEEEEDTPGPPAQPSYWSTVTVAMHITSVVATPKATPKPTRKKTSTFKSTTRKLIYTDAWDGTKHAAVQMTSRHPPVKTFITPNPTPSVGDKGSMMAGNVGIPQRGLAKPAPRPAEKQKPVLDRKSMLRASTNRFRGYTSTRRHAITYTPEAKNNGPTVTVIYTTVHGGTGREVPTFKASSAGKPTSVITTISIERSEKSPTPSTTQEKTTMETSIIQPADKTSSNDTPETPSNTRPKDL